jgi:hypothetical protein
LYRCVRDHYEILRPRGRRCREAEDDEAAALLN